MFDNTIDELVEAFSRNESTLLNELVQNRFWIYRLLEDNNNRVSSYNPNLLLDLFLCIVFLVKLPIFLVVGCKYIYVQHGRKYLASGKMVDPFFHFETEKNNSLKLVIVSSTKQEKIAFKEFFSNELKLPKTALAVPCFIFYFLYHAFLYKKNSKLASRCLGGRKDLVEKLTNRLLKTKAYNLVCYIVIKCFRKADVRVTDFYSSNSSWCVAANKLGRTVTEYQHGHINNQHYGYQVPLWINSECLPDKIVVFHEAWNKVLRELGWKKVIVKDNPFMFGNSFLNGTDKVNNAYKILLITQPSVLSFQLEILNDLSQYVAKEDVCVRLHPKLANSVKQELAGYTLTSAETSSLVQDISQSQTIVGCFSTALIEASFCHDNVFSIYNEDSYEKTTIFGEFGIHVMSSEELLKLVDTIE